MRDVLPELLFHAGPRGLLYWQWAAIPVLALFAWLAGRMLGKWTRALFTRIAKRTSSSWDDALVDRMASPITAAWALAVLILSTPVLALGPNANEFIQKSLRTGLYAVFLWALVRMVDVIATAIAASPWATSHPASRSLVPLGARVVKVLVAAVAIVSFLAQLGYPVTSLLAGLGIGGLALALAAQKTVENLFGAFSIGLDQPFREGDFVKIDDFVGTIEAIGLRSTRVRTLDRTIVTIPNGRLADMRVESFAVRDRIRLATTIQLVYSTTASQMRAVLAGLERELRAHEKIWPDAVVVKFKELGAHSLDVEVMAWFETSDWGEFQGIRQEMLLRFMDVVETAGSAFAFPTRTLHLVPEGDFGRASGVTASAARG